MPTTSSRSPEPTSDAAFWVEVAAGPDAAPARVRCQRFLEAGGAIPPADAGGTQAEARRLLLALAASGDFLPGLLLPEPAALAALAADPFLTQPKPRNTFAAEGAAAAAGATSFDDLKRRLRVWRRREMLRMGARELGWGTTEEVAAELTAFADTCLEQAYRFCDAALREEIGVPRADPESGEEPPSFVVIAMGKQGGGELNFSSDVDLIYFYSTDAGEVPRAPAGEGGERTPEPWSLHRYYAELSRRITDAIEDVTADGTIFRVDLRLRPEGRGGPLCNSFTAVERYYETFGRTWERQALLRARPCAGDLALGERILEMLDAFIYPRHIEPKMVDEIRELRGMFRPKRDDVASGLDHGFDVKLGTGGIRDVELVAQTLQLLHAGKRRDLRERHTPRALRRLRVAGLISDREAHTLVEAYRLWRRIEHRVQVQDAAQTQLMPADPAERETLARRLAYPDRATFDAEVQARRAEVQAIVDTFDDAEPTLAGNIEGLFDDTIEREELERRMAALGFVDVDASASALEWVRVRFPRSVIVEAAASPDPDRALAAFRDLAARGSLGLHAIIAEHPQLRRMLATLFGVSERLSRLLIIRPEVWEPFLDNLGAPERSLAELGASLDRRLAAVDAESDAGDDLDLLEELEGHELRRFQSEETLRIGLHDVAGSLSVASVARQLTELAEVCLQRGLGRMLARRQAQAEAKLGNRGKVPIAPLTVLGLGSLGAYEMRYGSDLDLVFLYQDDLPGLADDDDARFAQREFFAKLARRFINGFGAMLEEGRLYSVDTRLRPSGEQGLLVTSHRAFERYHQHEAAGWERVALLRARVVFSNAVPEERAAFEATLAHVAYEAPFDADTFRADLRRMRDKVEAERGKVPPGSCHLRFDPGGIMDVEFLGALGQLAGGARDRGLRTTQTPVALARLIETAGWPATLATDYDFLRAMAMRMRLLRDRPEDVVGPRDFAPLARTFEADVARQRDELDAAMRRIRAFFTTQFAG